MWHICLVPVNWHIFVCKGENDIMMKILGTTLQNLVARHLFTPVMEMPCGNYISPLLNTSIQTHHIQHRLTAVPGSTLTLVTEAWVHLFRPVHVRFFTEWISTGIGVVWTLWFFLSASFHKWFIFIHFIHVSQRLYNLSLDSIKKYDT